MPFPATTLYELLTRGEVVLSLGTLWKTVFGASSIGEAGATGYAGGAFGGTVGTAAYWGLTPEAQQAVSCEYTHLAEGSGRYAQLFACLSNAGLETINGYRVRFEEEAVAGKFKVWIEKITANVYSELSNTAGVTIAAKDLIGLSVEGGKVIAWHKAGAGAWEVVHEVADASYVSGNVGLGHNGSNGRLKDFRCGKVITPPFPGLTVLDSFKRAPENPLSNGGKWLAQKDEANAKRSGLISGEAYHSSEGFGAPSNNYWAVEELTNPTVTFEQLENGGEGRTVQLWACIKLAAEKVVTGYKGIFEYVGAGLTIKVFKYTAEAGAELGQVAKIPNAAGYQYALTVEEGKVIAWLKMGETMDWLPVLTLTDGAYTTGYVGIGDNGSAPGQVKFAVGTAAAGHAHVLTIAQPQVVTLTVPSSTSLLPMVI